jgi:hypothetical protein
LGVFRYCTFDWNRLLRYETHADSMHSREAAAVSGTLGCIDANGRGPRSDAEQQAYLAMQLNRMLSIFAGDSGLPADRIASALDQVAVLQAHKHVPVVRTRVSVNPSAGGMDPGMASLGQAAKLGDRVVKNAHQARQRVAERKRRGYDLPEQIREEAVAPPSPSSPSRSWTTFAAKRASVPPPKDCRIDTVGYVRAGQCPTPPPPTLITFSERSNPPLTHPPHAYLLHYPPFTLRAVPADRAHLPCAARLGRGPPGRTRHQTPDTRHQTALLSPLLSALCLFVGLPPPALWHRRDCCWCPLPRPCGPPARRPPSPPPTGTWSHS